MKSIAALIGGIFALVIVGVLIAAFACFGMYQGVIRANNEVDAAWGQVQNVYQRRSELIPNLVSTVKGAAAFEKDTFTAVATARAQVGQLKIDPSKAPSKEDMEKFAAAQQNLGTALSRLMSIQERYPELKANRNFTMLQEQLEGTENRITVERMTYNSKVLNLNNRVTIPPSSIFAGMAGIQKRDQFKADEKAQAAPQVNFN